MKIAKLTNNGMIMENAQIPVCRKDQILVRNMYCGICEGDVHKYRKITAEKDPDEKFIGHEPTGMVVEVGENVDTFKEGDIITSDVGKFAEYFITNPERIVNVPDEIDPLWAIGEPIACCVHAAGRFGINLGDRVCILGCGFMGLVCMQLANLQGSRHICAIDPIKWRLDFAKKLGADTVYTPSNELIENLDKFDVVIEAAGVQETINTATQIVKNHGRLIIIGYHQNNDGLREIDMKTWNYKAIDVVNGHVRNINEKREAMKKGIDLMAAGRLNVKELVTSYRFSDIDKAFNDLVSRKKDLFKAVTAF